MTLTDAKYILYCLLILWLTILDKSQFVLFVGLVMITDYVIIIIILIIIISEMDRS